MATEQKWLRGSIYCTIWQSPLFARDLKISFGSIVEAVSNEDNLVHVLFDVQDAGTIPMNAPYLALHSGFMKLENLGHVAVVGMDRRAQVLADIVVKVVRKEIVFFPTYDEALAYLKLKAKSE